MDKRSYFGLLLIGAVLVIMFLWTSKPQGQKAKQEEYKQQVASNRAADQTQQALPVSTAEMADSLNPLLPALSGQAESIIIGNELVQVSISTKGGVPESAELSGYKNQEGGNVTIFSPSEISLNFRFDGKMRNIASKDLYFTPVHATPNSVTMRLNTQQNGYMDWAYSIEPGSYLVNLKITAVGMQDFFPSDLEQLSIDWIQNLRQQEKGFEFEQRYTTLTYKRSDKRKSKYLTVASSPKSINTESQLDWIAFKNQFFSTIMVSPQTFAPDARLSAESYTKGKGYMKKMMAKVHVPFSPSGQESTTLSFYFGPNDYKILRNTGRQIADDRNFRLNRVIDLGWPIVREINRFIVIPLFGLLSHWGINMGIVILLLTIIIKLIVYPFTYKSYVSSAKMRALKPYVDEIAAKYPLPEDNMKKQQETMAVYNKYGVSPMGGCIPSLIQMPVWMALFFFVPNAIELRQQSFLWATDLTGFDDIIHWGTRIPLIGDHLSIFCVLFCLSNLLSTYISMNQQQQTSMPGQEDSMKMMKWMMYLMPVIFFFTFNNYSSGLNYYYFISAITSVLIMVYLRKTTDIDKLRAKLEANYKANKSDPKKSRTNTLMARMEALQKEQEKMNKR